MKSHSFANVRNRFAVIVLVLAASVLVWAGSGCNHQPEQPVQSSSQTVETTFTLEGMTCASCALTVRTAAQHVDGVVGARVSFDDAKAWVTYDPARTNPQAIADAITRAGYRATPVQP